MECDEAKPSRVLSSPHHLLEMFFPRQKLCDALQSRYLITTILSAIEEVRFILVSIFAHLKDRKIDTSLTGFPSKILNLANRIQTLTS